MEFFEKAHVVKRKQDGDDNMKKQLKQMLYGYKKNDNELIRNAANINNEQDSSSVSGFSDLNLTVSSAEENSTRQRISLIDPNISWNSLESESQRSQHEDIDNNTSDNSSDGSLSDIKEDIQSLSEEVSLNLDNSKLSDDLDDSFSITSTSLDESEDIESVDEPFDSDGKLASAILQKLNMKDAPTKSKIKNIKNRNKTNKESDTELFTEEICNLESDHSSVTSLSESEFDRESEGSMNYTNVLSPSFVSVVASDMPNQSLSDVLGDYTYPTIRMLPSESQNVFATNKSGIFSTMDLDESEVSKPSDSLIPEVGSVLGIDDELDIDLDTSTNMVVDESSLGCENASQTDETFQKESSTESIDTKFVNPAQVYYGKNCCVLVLKHPTEIFVHGKVKVTSMGGRVEIGGYTLKDGKYNVFAPNYNCAQYLRTLEHDRGYYGLFGKLTGLGLSVATVEEIVTSLGAHDSVVQFQRLTDRVSQFVENTFGSDLFTKINKNVDNCFKKASELLGCSLYLMKPWKSFEENQCWKQVLKYGYKHQSRGIICGGKGSGKSTFLRYYVNKLLAASPVLVIDLDPGQCEFTVAGSVSATIVTEPLLGPNFTHLKKPERMLNIGLINTMDNTRLYIAAVKEIIAYCHNEERFKGLPWVVNTMGMCNALGLQFMTLITMLLQPTFMVQLDSKNSKKRFETYLNPHAVRSLYSKFQYSHIFRSVTPPDDLEYSFVVIGPNNTVKNHSMAPKDERYLNFLAYFGTLTLDGTMDSILGIVPYEVDLRSLYIACNVKVNTSNIARVINGKLVALCKRAADNGDRVFTLTDKPLRCYGHGLIRGIDEERGFCYVVTPAAELEGVEALVYADWAPELGAPQRLPAGTLLPYRAPAQPLHRQLLSAPRRRYNPIQLIKARTPKVKASVS